MEDPDWRSNTVLILDGAPYHQAEASKALLEGLQIPVMMLGPYSYEASVCELYFAAFKSGDINPDHFKTGKGNFQKIIDLAVAQCQKIPKHQLILNWHHCIYCIYRYLDFYRL